MGVVSGSFFLNDQSLNATFSTQAVSLEKCSGVSFQFQTAASGSRAGTLKVEVSNDGVNWVDKPIYDSAGAKYTTITISASTEYNIMIELVNTAARLARLTWTLSTGTGTADITGCRKEA